MPSQAQNLGRIFFRGSFRHLLLCHRPTWDIQKSVCSTSSLAFHVEHTGLPDIPQKGSGTVGFFPVISAKLLAVSLQGFPLYPGTQWSVTSFHFASATRFL